MNLLGPEDFGETIVYFGIGTFVKKLLSLDQQIPDVLKLFYDTDRTAPKVKVILFDPEFRNDDPLIVQVENNNDELQWKKLSSPQCNQNSYQKGNIMLIVLHNWFDAQAKFFGIVQEYIFSIIDRNGIVMIGVFTQPYVKVEENEDIINLYNSCIPILKERNKEKQLQYFHLVDYGERSRNLRTMIWVLDGEPHCQDEAVMKEVARYKGEGINFGVCAYAQFPGTKFQILNEESEIDYAYIQQQVEQEVSSIGEKAILMRNECSMDQYFPSFLKNMIHNST